MKMVVYNHQLILEFNEKEYHIKEKIKNLLRFKNKAIEYQLNKYRMSKKQYEELSQKLRGEYYIEKENTLIVPSGFLYLFKDKASEVIDKTQETGYKCSFSYINSLPKLRDYQLHAIEEALNNRRGIICLATGLGKTLLSIELIRRFGKNTLVITPNKSIAKQFYDQLVYYFGEEKVGFIGDGKVKIKDINVGIIQSVLNKIDQIPEVGLIIIDETHHVPAETLYSIMNVKNTTEKVIGLSATPFRYDGLDMHINAIVGKNLVEYDSSFGIKNKFLAQPVFLFRKLTGKGRDCKDKVYALKSFITENKTNKELIIQDIKNIINTGKNTLILVPTIEFGKEIQAEIGCPFATGEDKQSYEYLKMFNNGEIKALIGTASKIGEGADTVRVDILVLASFVANKGSLLQQIGRGLRLYHGKNKVVIVDYCPIYSSILSRHAQLRKKIYKELGEVKES